MIARRVKPILWAALATAALGTSASAGLPLTPGTNTKIADSVLTPTPGATLVADTGLQNFVGKNALNQIKFTGQYEQWVYRKPAGLGGTLDFVTFFSNDMTSPDFLSSASLTDYTGFTTEVGYDMQSPGDAIPDQVARPGVGDTIDFDYSTPVAPGQNSAWLLIKTNATTYQSGTLNLIDGAVSTNAVFAPSTPEPASLALLFTGGLPLLGLLRRRTQA